MRIDWNQPLGARGAASLHHPPNGAGLRHLCGIVTQDRMGATLYFAGEFKTLVPTIAISRRDGRSHHPIIPIPAQEGT